MRPPPSHETRLARLARERFVGELTGAFRGMADEALTALSTPDRRPGSGKTAQERQAAAHAFQRAQAQWVASAGRALQKQLKPIEAAESDLSDLNRATGGNRLAFTLMDEDEIENKIWASRLALGVSDEANRELNDLRLRIQKLEHRPELPSQDVLKPDTVAAVLVAQWMACGLSRETWALVSGELRAPLAQGLLEAYHHANEFLVGQGVMPEIDLRELVRRSAHASGGPSAGPARALAAGASGAGHGAGVAGGGDDDLSGFGELGAADTQRTGDPAPKTAAAQETRLLTNVSPLARARERAQGVLGQLRQLLTDQVAGYQKSAAAPPSPALAAALRQPPPAFAPTHRVMLGQNENDVRAVSREIHRHTAELKTKADTASEKATIEIVALMFQAILAEERIPAGVRVWFARLQMPVLREALAEPEFFGSLTHPARQLIDQMGSCALGFEAQTVDSKALEDEIRRVVQTIEQYPETGQRVFALMGEEFRQFLARFLTEKGPTQRLVSVARQVEEKETLVIQFTIELRNQLKLNPAPHEIREFLFKIWAEVLAITAIRHGVADAQTLAFKHTATELLGAASTRPHTEERAQAITALPQLQRKLRQGLSLLGMPAGVQDIHLKIVHATLAGAFKSKTQVMSQAQLHEMAEQLAELETLSGPGGAEYPLNPADVKTLLGQDADAVVVVTEGGSQPNPAMQSWAKELELGGWFTLDHRSQLIKTQYVWRSDRNQLHLLAAADGKCYLLQARRLAAYLQAGLLVPTEDETLTVRATREALAKLGADPKLLLA